jgi:hypothetical protein
MFEATVDKLANMLKLRFAATVGVKEAKQGAQEVEALLGQLQQGFRMLTDMRDLEVMALECVPYIKHVMDLCDRAGIKMVVRIIPDPRKDIGLNILSLFHYRRAVKIVTCQSFEEAQSVLAK